MASRLHAWIGTLVGQVAARYPTAICLRLDIGRTTGRQPSEDRDVAYVDALDSADGMAAIREIDRAATREGFKVELRVSRVLTLRIEARS